MRLLLPSYALLSYGLFLAVFAAFIGFLWNLGLPGAIDGGAAGAPLPALLGDLALIALFGAQHSVMARPGFKRAWTTIVPAAAERSTYVLISSLLLALLMAAWRPLPALLWDLRGGLLGATILALSAAGWVFMTIATFAIDHFHLFGLRQALDAARGRAPREPAFRIRGPYRVVRHPIMLGFLVAFWAVPAMSVGHLIFNASMTAYILVALRHEERDLVAALGRDYLAYAARTPRLLPLPQRRSSRS